MLSKNSVCHLFLELENLHDSFVIFSVKNFESLNLKKKINKNLFALSFLVSFFFFRFTNIYVNTQGPSSSYVFPGNFASAFGRFRWSQNILNYLRYKYNEKKQHKLIYCTLILTFQSITYFFICIVTELGIKIRIIFISNIVIYNVLIAGKC